MSDYDSPLRRFSEVFVRTTLGAIWGVKVTGLESVPRSGPLIVAFNHASLLDGPLVGAVIAPARRICFLGKRELFDNPVLGWYLTRAGAIPLERGTMDMGAMRSALELLGRGGSIGMSPEGTRVKRGETRPPKLGVSFLSSKSGALVLPTRILGTGDFPRTFPLEVRFGSPLAPPPADAGREGASAFAQKVMDAVYAL